MNYVFLFWPIISLFIFLNRFVFKILILFYYFNSYIICKNVINNCILSIPSFSHRNITYRDLFIFIIFRYLNLFWGFINNYVLGLLFSTYLHIMTILIICSFFLFQGFLFLEYEHKQQAVQLYAYKIAYPHVEIGRFVLISNGLAIN